MARFWKRIFGDGQKVIRLRGSAPFEAASVGRRTALWNPVGEAINALTAGNVDSLRAKSRDLMRKNPWALNAVDSYVANAIGTGIKPKSKHPDPEIKKRLQELWLDWTDEADASGLTDLYGLQALALRSVMEGGDVIVRFRPRLDSDGLTVPLQLQVLESEHLPSTLFIQAPNGNLVRAGIEFDKIGRRVAYHLYREHPGERYFFQNQDLAIVPVPATSALIMMRPMRPGQLRGVPWLSVVLMRLYELDKFDDAELMKQQVAALFAGFIEKGPEDQPFGTGQEEESDGALVQGLEPATMQELPIGSKISFSNPPQNQTYETFLRSQLRSIAAGAGSTYEQLTGDLTGVNYSSIRAGVQEFRRKCAQVQFGMVVFQFCRPVWNKFLEAAVLAGEIEADDYLKNMRLYRRVDWMPDRWPWVDPLKDIQAEKELIRGGLKARSASVSEQGFDIEEVDAEVAADNARADSLGLVYDTDPRKTDASGKSIDAGSSLPEGKNSNE